MPGLRGKEKALPVSARDRASFAPLLAELEERFWGEETRSDRA